MMSPGANATALVPNVYKLDPAAYPAFRRRLVVRLSILIPLVLVGLAYLTRQFDIERDYLVLLVVLPVVGCSTAYHQVKEQRRNWESLEFEFRDGKLIRSLDKYPPLEFAPNEVTAILESSKGITIKTKDRLRTLSISNRLSNFSSFRSQLSFWAPAVPVTKWDPSALNYARFICELLACAWVFGGPLYLMYTQHLSVILPLGIILAVSMLAMLLYVRKSPHMPTRARKAMWVLLLLPILATVCRLAWPG